LSESSQSLVSKEGIDEADGIMGEVVTDSVARAATDNQPYFEQKPSVVEKHQEHADGDENIENDSMVGLRNSCSVKSVDIVAKEEENDEEKFRKRLSSIVKPSPDAGNLFYQNNNIKQFSKATCTFV